MPVVRDIVVFGAGGYARVAADAAEASGLWRVAAFIETAPEVGATMLGRPVWPQAEVFAGGRGPGAGLVAVGDNFLRQRVVAAVLQAQPAFEFVTTIHPRATVSRHATVGVGSVLLAGAIVNPAARVGAHVALYTNAIVEHDNEIADYVTLAPAATLGGSVRIGERTFVGLGAVISHGCFVGADSVIGANATVLHGLPACVTAVGTPARISRARVPGEPYLS